MSIGVHNTGGLVRGAVANTTAPVYADNTHVPLSMDLSDAGLRVHVQNGGSGGTASADKAAFTAGSSTGTPIMGAVTPTDTGLSANVLAIAALDANRNVMVNVAAGSAGGAIATDEAAWTAGASTFAPIGGAFNDSAAALTSGQEGTARSTANRALHVNIRKADGTELGILATPVRTDPTGTTTQPVSAASLPLPTGASTLAGQTTGNTSLASIDGKITAVNTGAVVVSSSALPAGAATAAKQPALGTSGTPSADILSVQGPTASGSALTATPVTMGGLAKTALPTAVSDGQVVNGMLDKFGRQVVLPGAPRDLIGTQATTISASTSETTIVTAAASIFNDLALLTVANTSATAVRVDFRDDTAGTIILSLYCAAGQTTGFVPHIPVPQTAVNKNWTATSSASVTDLRIFAQFVKNK